MNLVFAHFKAQALEIARLPYVLLPTIALPIGAFLFFALPNSQSQADANALLVSFIAFAVLTVSFFQFGIGVALERDRPWERFLRILPATFSQRLAARMLTGVLYAVIASVPVIVVALVFTPASLSPWQWLSLPLVLLAGAIPFCLLGMVIGYWARPKAALPLANLLFFPLVYIGGLWTLPGQLPGVVADLSPFTPTRQWSEVLASLSEAVPPPLASCLALGGFTVAFAALAAWGYKRDEAERFA